MRFGYFIWYYYTTNHNSHKITPKRERRENVRQALFTNRGGKELYQQMELSFQFSHLHFNSCSSSSSPHNSCEFPSRIMSLYLNIYTYTCTVCMYVSIVCELSVHLRGFLSDHAGERLQRNIVGPSSRLVNHLLAHFVFCYLFTWFFYIFF